MQFLTEFPRKLAPSFIGKIGHKRPSPIFASYCPLKFRVPRRYDEYSKNQTLRTIVTCFEIFELKLSSLPLFIKSSPESNPHEFPAPRSEAKPQVAKVNAVSIGKYVSLADVSLSCSLSCRASSPPFASETPIAD
jgi:hypothetical protein